MRVKLAATDTIITAFAQPAHGPGWANHPVIVIIRDGDGRLREEYIQPDQQSEYLYLLYNVSSAAHTSMTNAVHALLRPMKKREKK